MESSVYLLGLASIVVLGITAQWAAWRLGVPAILMLLLFGCLAGPGTEWLARHGVLHDRFLDPNRLFGEMLLPAVSLCVAIILFEGGLTLNIAELSSNGRIIFNLVTIGALATWLVATLGARLILGLDMYLALLFGAILVVTGPTVIGPLLRQVRPTGSTSAILKWEGIVIDPIGALLTVVVFEAIPVGKLPAATAVVVTNVGLTVVVGGLIGVAAAGLLVLILGRYWAPDYLQNPVALMLVLAAFTASNLIQGESGLFAVTIMGIVLANQKRAQVRHILEFKESLVVLLVSSLFILLGARLRIDDLALVSGRVLLFVGVLILVARPLAVVLSTRAAGLTGRERVFLMCMAPRGIVAAAVSSVFAIRLRQAGYPGAERLVPYTFAVIIGTVLFYGMLAGWSARRLGLTNAARRGFLIAGANPVARAIAAALRNEGYGVMLVDTNRPNLAAARGEGLPVTYGSVLSSYVLERIELTGIGRLLALTPNEEVNALASLHFSRVFGRSEVYQLSPGGPAAGRGVKVAQELRGRALFASHATYEFLEDMLQKGAVIRRIPVGMAPSPGGPPAIPTGAVPLFLIDEVGQITFFALNQAPAARGGQTLVVLAPPAGAPLASGGESTDDASRDLGA